MINARWIVQNNLISKSDLQSIKNACQKLKVSCEEVYVVPFSEKLPQFPQDEKTNIYYGATAFIQEVHSQFSNSPGIFFDENLFSVETCMYHWQKHMLNAEGKITTLEGFSQEDHQPETRWFIRPNADDKSFAGEIICFSEFKEWYKRLIEQDLDPNTKILVAPPYSIKKEWRNYIVDGTVVASTLYRKNFKLNISNEESPRQVIDFIEKRCEEYMPHKLFALDIALCGDEYFIIECNCLNSIGFYGADIFTIVKSITKFVESSSFIVEYQ
ncbi:ATP-grasp domain-containing protein [Candidatus Uabimicrobium sp. HlEnr_7]|uniref:ATP-grasp domain-containing protein n=1 Tax=Candidatus Uabimicrobium helgolandensis TaxID=3095367 RepID=UPI0035567AA9